MKCPICDNDVKEYYDDYTNYTLCEEFARCEDEYHHYSYQYAYGNTEEMIGGVTFYSHYRDSQKERKLQSIQYRAVLEAEREHYKNIKDKEWYHG